MARISRGGCRSDFAFRGTFSHEEQRIAQCTRPLRTNTAAGATTTGTTTNSFSRQSAIRGRPGARHSPTKLPLSDHPTTACVRHLSSEQLIQQALIPCSLISRVSSNRSDKKAWEMMKSDVVSSHVQDGLSASHRKSERSSSRVLSMSCVGDRNRIVVFFFRPS